MPSAAAALSLLLLVAALPAAFAHGVFEASELEIHLLNDEGSDAIEPYGGYDINELFIGFAHDASIGKGAAGDGLYLRAELYGLMANSAPLPGQTWTVAFTFSSPSGAVTRTLSTTDTVTLTSDFDSLLYDIDTADRSTHVQRAFLSFAHAGLRPGDLASGFRVESRVNGDLRDIAPGGIPVPGSNGAATYPDPTQIDGKGVLVDSVATSAPTGYILVEPTAAPGTTTFQVQSLLAKGGQHVYVLPSSTAGWDFAFNGTTNAPLGPSGNLTFSLAAKPQAGAAPFAMDIFTDVGGRTPVTLDADGTLHAGGVTLHTQPESVAKPSPGVGPLLGLALLVVAGVARRRA